MVVLFDEKWLSNIAPEGHPRWKSCLFITSAKIWDSRKIQQLQSKPSHTSQAKADSPPEANNLIKVQSIPLPLPPFFFFRLTKSYNCPDDLWLIKSPSHYKALVGAGYELCCDIIEEDHLLPTHKIMAGESVLCKPIPSSLDKFSTCITPEWNFKEHDTS